MTVAGKPVRLQKLLARAGIASRRECERLIDLGRVRVDGRVVREQGLMVDPDKSRIDCNGTRVKSQKKVYYLLNKPKGVVCSNSDELGRCGAVELIGDTPFKLNTVGRLDKDSEGLLVITNDGKLTNMLTHPRYRMKKTYHVRVDGRITGEDLSVLRKGVRLAGGKIRPTRIRVLGKRDRDSVLEVELKDGRNRAIRRILATVGHPVKRLRRVAIGPLADDDLKPGQFRKLTRDEVADLFRGAMHSKKAPRGDQK